ncbi:hypothetical protein C8Q79DRAFT_988242 [Trametes meyenii]|nr:hypothetical protein C8Q79DRAFT_988242 [Trametes meyenii]
MILVHFHGSDAAWLASMTTLCRALREAFESMLYESVILDQGKLKPVRTFLRSVVTQPRRAACLRKLHIEVARGSTLQPHLKRALPLFANLCDLVFIVDDPPVFELLRNVPFKLRSFGAGGMAYPKCFLSVLVFQPTIEHLALSFDARGCCYGAVMPCFSDPKLFPRLRSLALDAECFPPHYFLHSYPITELMLDKPYPNDITKALQLFGQTLVSLTIERRLADRTTLEPSIWPTSAIFEDGIAVLPNLRFLDVFDTTSSFRSGEFDGEQLWRMQVPGLGKACPAIRTVVWSVEREDIDCLSEDQVRLTDRYARMLFKQWPTLVRFAFLTPGGEMEATGDGPYGHVWTRGHGVRAIGPEKAEVGVEDWRREEMAGSQ